jgi:hypothetical protein
MPTLLLETPTRDTGDRINLYGISLVVMLHGMVIHTSQPPISTLPLGTPQLRTRLYFTVR